MVLNRVGLTRFRSRLGATSDPADASLVRGIAVLASGTALGQAITVVGAPLLSRFYSPEQVGIFGIYFAIVSIATVAVSLRYEAALPLPESDGEAIDLLLLTVLTTVGIGLLLGVATRFANDYGAIEIPPAV